MPAAQHTGRDEAADDLRTMIAELSTGHRHREHYTRQIGATVWAGDHVTDVPSLIWQLEHAIPAKAGDDGGAAGYRSQPAAWLESLDTLARIDVEASRWVTDMGGSDHGTTTQIVLRLGGLLPSVHRCARPHAHLEHALDESKQKRVTCCQWHAVERDVKRWWTQARIVTGWQSPAWRPNNTCPMCGVRGTLRVRLSDRSALCVDCRETWDSTTIGLLAEHIRGENVEAAVVAQGARI